MRGGTSTDQSGLKTETRARKGNERMEKRTGKERKTRKTDPGVKKERTGMTEDRHP